MENENVLYIFGKELTEHLETKESSQRYLEMRYHRFRDEFLSCDDVEFYQIQMILDSIHEYLSHCMEAQELDHCLFNLKQSMFWLTEYSFASYE